MLDQQHVHAECPLLQSLHQHFTACNPVPTQPPLDAVPNGDWYCPTCIADGKAGKPAKQARSRKAKQKPPPPGRRTLGNRALAAMLSDDEDSPADFAVSVKVLGESNR